MTFRARLIVLSAVGTALAVAGSSLAVYVLVRRQLHDDVANQLRARAAIHSSRNYANIRQLRPLGGRRVEPPTLPRLISADGRVLESRYPQLQYPLTAEGRMVAAGERSSSLEDIDFAGARYKVLTVRAGSRRALQLAQSLAPLEDTLDELFVVLLVVTAAGVGAAPLVGVLVAGGALRPVRGLTRATKNIAATGDLDYRIPVRGRDELASLAESFNAMLDRLEEMVETVERARRAQRQLVADASHELRTPLASVRANIELLGLEPGDRAELLRDILQQLDGLTTLVMQLIDLAHEEVRESERVPIMLDDVVRDAVERTRQNYPHIEVAADLEPTTVLGARDSLERVVANLLDNAAKWSPHGGRVDVSLRGGALRVRDHGEGFAESDLPYVFERFYRGAHARDRPGTGLGLAIVAEAVSAHGGEVRAERADGGGALLTARFPSHREEVLTKS